MIRRDLPWEYGPPGRPSNSVLRPFDRSTTHPKVNPRRPRRRPSTTKPAHHHHHLSISQKKSRKRKRKKMIVSTLRRSLQRTHAPHRRLPFSTSTSSASSSSSSSSSSNSASAAQKKAQDALGNVSAVFMRAGTYARSALGPFGARLSGLLGCQYTHTPPFSLCRALLFYLQY